MKIKNINLNRSFFFINNIYYVCLKNKILSSIKVNKLILFKFKNKQVKLSYYVYFFLLLARKKLNSLYFYKKIYLIGLDKLMQAARKKKQLLINGIYSHLLLKSKKKKFKSYLFSHTIQNDKIFFKTRKLKMLYVLYNFHKFRFKKEKKFKNYKILHKKRLFHIKSISRNSAALFNIKYNILNSIIFKTEQSFLIYILIKLIYTSCFNEYNIMFFLFRSKFQNLKNNHNISTLLLQKHFDKNYLLFEYKNKIYYNRFIRYQYITKRYAVGYVNKNSVAKFYNKILLNLNIHSVKLLLYLLFTYYKTYWLKSYYTKLLYKYRTSITKISFSFFRKFNLNTLISYKTSGIYYNICSFVFNSSYLISKKFYIKILEQFVYIFWRCSWRFYGVYQIEMFYFYISSCFYQDINYISLLLLNDFYNNYLLNLHIKTNVFSFGNLKKILLDTLFLSWFTRKKVMFILFYKFNYNFKYNYLKKNIYFFFIFIDIFVFDFLKIIKTKYLKKTMKMKKYWIKTTRVKYRIESISLYKKKV